MTEKEQWDDLEHAMRQKAKFRDKDFSPRAVLITYAVMACVCLVFWYYLIMGVQWLID